MNKNRHNNSKLNSALSLALVSTLVANNTITLAVTTDSITLQNTIDTLDSSNASDKAKLSIDDLIEYSYKTVYRSNISDHIIGINRHNTATSMSSSAYTQSDKVILVVSNMDDKGIQPDAQVASTLAAALDSPLLFTQKNGLPDTTLQEIKRLEAKEVIVVGGESTIPNNTLTPLNSLGLKIERVSGEGRWDTSAKVATKIAANSKVSKAIVINSSNNTNISAAVSASVALNAPILYVTDKNIDPSVESFLNNSSIEEVYVIGTPDDAEGIAIPDSIFSKINSSKIRRVKATTQSDVSDYFDSLLPNRNTDSALIINYDNTVDMPIAAAYAKKKGMHLFLVDKTINKNTLSKFSTGKIKKVYCISSNIYSGTLNNIESAIYNSVYQVDTNIHDKLKISKRVNGSNSEIAANLALSSYEKSDSVVLSLISQNTEVGSPDALITAPLAKALNAPFLCIESPSSLDTATKDAIKKLGATKVYIAGGPAAISDDVANELNAMGLTIERISGEDRWETSYKFAQKINSLNKIDTAILINNKNLEDINSAILASLEFNAPILYSNGTSLREDITNMLNNNSIKNVYVIGAGSTDENFAITDSVLDKIKDKNKLIKISGGNSINTLATLRKDFKESPKKEISKDIKNTGVVINHSNISDIVAGSLYADKIGATPFLLSTILDEESKNIAINNNLNDLIVISNDVYAFSHGELENVIFEKVLKANNLLDTDIFKPEEDNKDNNNTDKDNTDKDNNNTDTDNTDKDDNNTDTDNTDKDNTDKDNNNTDTDNTDKDNNNTDDTENNNNQESNSTSGKWNPQTGDEGISQYIVGLALSLTTLIGLLTYNFKFKKNNHK